MPTPAVAMLTRSLRADLGVMISASHNPYRDNGIKLFGPDGYKLSDAAETEIEARADADAERDLAEPEHLGRAVRLEDARGRYTEFSKQTFPKGLTLEGLKIVVDCANGAAYRVAPDVLFELGADVVPIGVDPDGFNINKDCGSTATDFMCSQVVVHGADIGIALDGDADRVLIADERGRLVDGDQLMALIVSTYAKRGLLTGGGLVATVMSNLGLERFLIREGLSLVRTKVGDRHVVEHMRDHGFNVGGEQSGHIILSDHATTGDGLVAALQVLSVVVEARKPTSEVCGLFDPLPQRLRNVRFNGSDPMHSPEVLEAIRDWEGKLGSSGRILVRKSGTEPLIRVMAEAEDPNLVDDVADSLTEVIANVAG